MVRNALRSGELRMLLLKRDARRNGRMQGRAARGKSDGPVFIFQFVSHSRRKSSEYIVSRFKIFPLRIESDAVIDLHPPNHGPT